MSNKSTEKTCLYTSKAGAQTGVLSASVLYFMCAGALHYIPPCFDRAVYKVQIIRLEPLCRAYAGVS